MGLERKKFAEIDLTNPFFDSLKADYVEFSYWFAKKADEEAYVFYDDRSIQGFLYLKIEDEELLDMEPKLPKKKRLKIGTFKIVPHGTRLGERFIKKVFDYAVEWALEEIYVTIFERHEALIQLLSKYGFQQQSTKHSSNGDELVLIKNIRLIEGEVLKDYPIVNIKGGRCYLLSIYPKWHTRLFPDSMLKTEPTSIIQDISHTNSIHKVYLAAMKGMDSLKQGDIIAIYRTSDQQGRAFYRSVVTSLCVIEEYCHLSSFDCKDSFFRYCEPYSVFDTKELENLWRGKKYPHVIRFTYNIALKKRPNRKMLLEDVGLSEDAYFGFMPLTSEHITKIAQLGEVNESLIIN